MSTLPSGRVAALLSRAHAAYDALPPTDEFRAHMAYVLQAASAALHNHDQTRPTSIPSRGCLLNSAIQGSKGPFRKLRSAAYAAIDEVYSAAWPSEAKPYKKTKKKRLAAQLQQASEQKQLELQQVQEENERLKRQLEQTRQDDVETPPDKKIFRFSA